MKLFVDGRPSEEAQPFYPFCFYDTQYQYNSQLMETVQANQWKETKQNINSIRNKIY